MRLRSCVAVLVGASLLTSCGWFGSKAKQLAPVEIDKPSAQLNVVWRVGMGGKSSASTHGFAPVLVGDAIYAAAPDGQVAALGAADGRQRWRVNVGEPLSAGVGAGENLLYVGARKGQVIALDASGKVAWRSQLSSEVLASPTAADSVVVARTTDGRLFGLEAENGQRRWLYQRNLPSLTLRNQPAATTVPGAVLLGVPGGKLAFLNISNGSIGWEATVALPRGSTELERMADVVSVPLTDEERACAVAYQGRVGCFELQSGNVIWARELSSSVSLAMDERAVYVADERGLVFAFDKSSGANLWRQDKLQERRLSAPTLLGSLVVLADEKGIIYALAKDNGALAAKRDGDGSPIIGRPVVREGTLIAQTRAGNVIALRAQ